MHIAAERRKHPRLARQFMVRYSLAGSSGQDDVSQVKDISLGGICLTTYKAFEKGAKLLLKIKLPGAEIMPTARVLDSRRLGTGTLVFCNTRLEFAEIKEADKQVLADRINTYLR
jgi:hypothetical protein